MAFQHRRDLGRSGAWRVGNIGPAVVENHVTSDSGNVVALQIAKSGLDRMGEATVQLDNRVEIRVPDIVVDPSTVAQMRRLPHSGWQTMCSRDRPEVSELEY